MPTESCKNYLTILVAFQNATVFLIHPDIHRATASALDILPMVQVAKYQCHQNHQFRMPARTRYFVRRQVNRWRYRRSLVHTWLTSHFNGRWHDLVCTEPPFPTSAKIGPVPCSTASSATIDQATLAQQRCHKTTPPSDPCCFSQKLPRRFIPTISSIHILLLFNVPQSYHSRICMTLEKFSSTACHVPVPDGNSTPSREARVVPTHGTTMQRPQKPIPNSFVDEWKTLRDLSGLVIGAVLAILQVPNVASHPMTRVATSMCLLFTVMGGMYSSALILHFLDSGNNAAFSMEKQDFPDPQSYQSIWNVWIMLSLPVIWTYWGVFYFLLSVIFLVWDATAPGTHGDSKGMSGALGPKLSLTLRLPMMGITLLGFIYLLATILTLRRISAQARRVANPV